jgi:DinB superfamily
MAVEENMRTCLAVGLGTIAAVATLSAQVQPVQKVGLIQYLQISHAGITRDLLAAAELMPEPDYGFKPSQMPEARTFAGVIAHTSAAMFDVCARLQGIANPVPGAGKKVDSKAEVIQMLREAVTLCNKAVGSLDQSNADVYIRQGPAEVPRSAVLVGLLAHDAEMYGISTVYLRAKNLVPPASSR